MKIAIIGTGLSAYGILEAINTFNFSQSEIKKIEFVFISGGNIVNKEEIRRSCSFPSFSFPKKFEFNHKLKKNNIKNTKKFYYWSSQTAGGLSDFWSCSVFPFRKKFLNSKYPELYSSYEKLSKLNTISSYDDDLKNIYDNFSCHRILKNMSYSSSLNQLNFTNDIFTSIHGSNRVILNKTNSLDCNYCGNCLSGCINNTLFRPYNYFKENKEPSIKIISTHVKKIFKTSLAKWKIFTDNDEYIFDYVFLSSGVINTLNILERSNLVNNKKIKIYDSNTFFSPVYISNTGVDNIDSFGYSSNIIATESKILDFNTHTNLMPFSSFLTEYFFGKNIISKKLKRYLLNHFSLACHFSSSSLANSYNYNKGQLEIEKDNYLDSKKIYKKIIDNWNKNSKYCNFLPLILKGGTSSHYSSNLLSSDLTIYKRAFYDDRLVIVDGNLFPGSPEPAPNSFSIMAGSFYIFNKFLSSVCN